MDDWQYDTFELEEVTGGRPLSALAFALIKRSGLIELLGVNEGKLARYVLSVGWLERLWWLGGFFSQGMIELLGVIEGKLARYRTWSRLVGWGG